MKTIRDIQKRLADRGYDVTVDGARGPQTTTAIKAFQIAHLLNPDGVIGPQTELTLFPETQPTTNHDVGTGLFDAASAKRLAQAHPDIQKIMLNARAQIAFTILDSQRGRAAQERAFKAGNTKAHFGDSAHNWSPAVAVDIAPIPLNWNDRQAFINLSKVILPIAKQFGIPLRWGGDWNMDGSTSDGWDLPHYELHPWRSFAKHSKPYGE